MAKLNILSKHGDILLIHCNLDNYLLTNFSQCIGNILMDENTSINERKIVIWFQKRKEKIDMCYNTNFLKIS